MEKRKIQGMKRGRNPHINNTIHKIFDCLRKEGFPLLLEEIEQRVNIPEAHRDDILTILKDNKRITFDEYQQRFSLKSLYPITDKQTLIEHLQRSPQGLPENHDLFDCYKGIQTDLAQLKEQKSLRMIYNKDKKHHALFWQDPNDPVEKLSKPASTYLKKIWRDIKQIDIQERTKILDQMSKRRKLN